MFCSVGGPLEYPLNTWQELNWNTTYSAPDFWWFCGNVTNDDAPSNVTDIDNVLSNYTNGEPWLGLGGYATFFQANYLPLCESGRYGSTDPGCFGTQNGELNPPPPHLHRLTRSQNHSGRISQTLQPDRISTQVCLINSLMKTQTNPREACLEVGAYQQAQPEGIPSLISRVIQPSYTQQWCNWSFPPGKYNSIPTTGPNLTYWNQYGGFNISGERLALIDGSESSQHSRQRESC